jgi:predicted transposase YbfD/YdcC
VKTDEQSNEITAIPELLKMLDVQGCIGTIDAMGCQKTLAQQIVEQGADYVLALKPNQGTLYAAVEQWFQTRNDTASEESSLTYYETEEQQHGRVEIRRHWTTLVPAGLPMAAAWAKLTSVGRVESERHVQGEVTIEQRYYIASVGSDA